jgi:hypothetical protein
MLRQVKPASLHHAKPCISQAGGLPAIDHTPDKTLQLVFSPIRLDMFQKRSKLFAGLLAACLFASACAGAAPAPTTAPLQPAGAEKQGNFLAAFLYASFGDPAELKAYQELVAAFEAKFCHQN